MLKEKPVSGEESGSVSCINEEFIDDSYDMFVDFFSSNN